MVTLLEVVDSITEAILVALCLHESVCEVWSAGVLNGGQAVHVIVDSQEGFGLFHKVAHRYVLLWLIKVSGPNCFLAIDLDANIDCRAVHEA